MPRDKSDHSCTLYISGDRVDPSVVSSLTGFHGTGFKKGDKALSRGKPIIRTYGAWSMDQKSCGDGTPQEAIDNLLSDIFSKKESFIKAVAECGEFFRVRVRVDMEGREEIFTVQIASDRISVLTGIISHFEIVAT